MKVAPEEQNYSDRGKAWNVYTLSVSGCLVFFVFWEALKIQKNINKLQAHYSEKNKW